MLTSEWKKSSFCFGGLGCLEVKVEGDSIFVRDDKNPDVVVRTDVVSWRAFVEGVKSSEFDH
ncbi:MAG: DUF397 domain-containing protein [bacterium]|nr:DUF397 domain-containing protein [bacterium]